MVGEMKGAIIAAGRGDRLRGAVDGLPKPLVEIDDEPMLLRQARTLREAGAAAAVVALINSETARLAELRKLAIPAWMQIEVRDTANSMESLFALSEHLGDAARFLLATVDAVVNVGELRRFVADAIELSDGPAARYEDALAVVRWRGERRPLFARVAADGAIASLGDPEGTFVTAGFYLLPATIFDLAPRARAAGLDAMRRLLAMAVESGMRLAAIELSDVIDVDESADLAVARAMVAKAPGRGSAAQTKES
jgi:NDP-sugar pyrophosphorylase family protein